MWVKGRENKRELVVITVCQFYFWQNEKMPRILIF